MLAYTKAISYGICLPNDMQQCLHYKAYYIDVAIANMKTVDL